MIRKMYVLMLLLFFSGFALQAQTRIVKTGLFATGFGLINGCYERVVSENSSIQFTGRAYFGFGDDDVSAFGAGIGYRLYITRKKAPRGFYLMPRTGINFGENANSVVLGADFGYQWIWRNGFVLDLAIGHNYFVDRGDNVVSDFVGGAPNVVFALGYSW